MEKQLILFITKEIVPFYYGGIGTQFKAMANLLVSAGYDVRFITRRHASFDEGIFKNHYPGCGYSFVEESTLENVTEFSYSSGLVSHFDLCYAQAVESELSDICREHIPQHIVSADFGGESFICLLKKREGKYSESNFVLFIEGSTYDALKTYESGVDAAIASELEDPRNALTCSMENACIYMSDHVISPTHITWQQTSDRLACTIEPSIIPNLVDTDFCSDSDSRSRGQEAKLLLFIGRLDHHKGADLLLQAFIQRYSEKKPEDIPMLRFIGRDAFCKKYGKTFLTYWMDKIPENLKNHIDFTGQVLPETIRQHLSMATLCVFPSRWEVFGIVCLEAMIARCPVAVSSHTGLAEVVGEDFREHVFNFAEDNSGVFDLYEHLLLMGRKEYDSLCRSFYRRAVEIVKDGNASLLEYFKSPCPPIGSGQYNLSQQVFGELGKCIYALGEISSILSRDFKRIVTSAQIDDQALKEAVNPRVYGSESKTIRARVLRSIKNRISNVISRQ